MLYNKGGQTAAFELSVKLYLFFILFFFNDLSLLHCNIRSLYKNIDKLEEIVTPCSKPPDIIALSETRIKETSIIATLPGYNFINENSQTQAGGVGAYIKNNLKYLQRRDLQFKIHGCENIWLEILGKRQKIIIGIVYRHPQYNIDRFSQPFSETTAKIEKNICVLCIRRYYHKSI